MSHEQNSQENYKSGRASKYIICESCGVEKCYCVCDPCDIHDKTVNEFSALKHRVDLAIMSIEQGLPMAALAILRKAVEK